MNKIIMDKKLLSNKLLSIFNTLNLNKTQKTVLIYIIEQIMDAIITNTNEIDNINDSISNSNAEEIELLNEDDDITAVINKVNTIINNLNQKVINN